MMSIKSYNGQDKIWYCGDSPPDLTGRGVEIQADGHELEWLKVALAHGAEAANKDYYKTVWGKE